MMVVKANRKPYPSFLTIPFRMILSDLTGLSETTRGLSATTELLVTELLDLTCFL